MVSGKKINTALIVLLLLTCCSTDSTLYLNGTANTIGAKVFIDSVKVGYMSPILTGSELKLKVKPGNHQLLVIGKNGQRFHQNFYIEGENYISVQFDSLDNSIK